MNTISYVFTYIIVAMTGAYIGLICGLSPHQCSAIAFAFIALSIYFKFVPIDKSRTQGEIVWETIFALFGYVVIWIFGSYIGLLLALSPLGCNIISGVLVIAVVLCKAFIVKPEGEKVEIKKEVNKIILNE